MMKIPPTTRRPVFYLATSTETALSSWRTEPEAWAAYARLREAARKDPRRYENQYRACVGVVETGPEHHTFHALPETALARRDRVAALVAAKFPTPLTPNRFVNTILDIIRGEMFLPTDRIEAIDALAEMHLESTLTWGHSPKE